jgi:hypothetical protein
MPAYLFRVGLYCVLANSAGRIGIHRIGGPAIQMIICTISIEEDSFIVRSC